ncbi:MAG: NAD-dependent epimerase/dehydratase family protein, partial [Pseudomonadota bacterium]
MTKVAALTGGTGFLGRHAIRALHDAGWRIRMLARRAPGLPELADVEIELIMGDLADAGALMRLCEGAEAIIHVAGVVKAATRSDFFRANATGAASIAAAWTQIAPDARFTLISSMAAREPHLSHYAASKREGERMVAEIGAGRDWRILRPGAIYGAHDEETLKVLKLARGPVQLMLNAGDARVSLIDVRDAARAVAALAAHPGTGAIHELT